MDYPNLWKVLGRLRKARLGHVPEKMRNLYDDLRCIVFCADDPALGVDAPCAWESSSQDVVLILDRQDAEMLEEYLAKIERRNRIGSPRIFVDCAAVRDETGLVYAVPRPQRHDGAIMKARHGEVASHLEQGFTLSNGVFVDRYEASKVALASGQITEMIGIPPFCLTSEDLW